MKHASSESTVECNASWRNSYYSHGLLGS
jgi:hypothetical protein